MALNDQVGSWQDFRRHVVERVARSCSRLNIVVSTVWGLSVDGASLGLGKRAVLPPQVGLFHANLGIVPYKLMVEEDWHRSTWALRP